MTLFNLWGRDKELKKGKDRGCATEGEGSDIMAENIKDMERYDRQQEDINREQEGLR